MVRVPSRKALRGEAKSLGVTKKYGFFTPKARILNDILEAREKQRIKLENETRKLKDEAKSIREDTKVLKDNTKRVQSEANLIIEKQAREGMIGKIKEQEKFLKLKGYKIKVFEDSVYSKAPLDALIKRAKSFDKIKTQIAEAEAKKKARAQETKSKISLALKESKSVAAFERNYLLGVADMQQKALKSYNPSVGKIDVLRMNSTELAGFIENAEDALKKYRKEAPRKKVISEISESVKSAKALSEVEDSFLRKKAEGQRNKLVSLGAEIEEYDFSKMSKKDLIRLTEGLTNAVKIKEAQATVKVEGEKLESVKELEEELSKIIDEEEKTRDVVKVQKVIKRIKKIKEEDGKGSKKALFFTGTEINLMNREETVKFVKKFIKENFDVFDGASQDEMMKMVRDMNKANSEEEFKLFKKDLTGFVKKAKESIVLVEE